MGSGASHLTSAQLLVLQRKSGWRPEDAGGIANESRSMGTQSHCPAAGWLDGGLCTVLAHTHTHKCAYTHSCPHIHALIDTHTQVHRHSHTSVPTDRHRCALRHVRVHTVTRTHLHTDMHRHTHTNTCSSHREDTHQWVFVNGIPSEI